MSVEKKVAMSALESPVVEEVEVPPDPNRVVLSGSNPAAEFSAPTVKD